MRLVVCCFVLLAAVAAAADAARPKAIIGYVFVRDRVLAPNEVAAEKLTHINYAFANIEDGRMVEGFASDAENFRVLSALKARNPALRVLVSVGGWTWSGNFSDAALTRESRARFVESAVAFLDRHHLDGLDVDWEFPGQKGLNNTYRPEDRENFTALLADLRSAFDRAGNAAGKRYLLTAATGAADSWLAHTDMDKAQAYLDLVNLMAYDQFGEWDSTTGHHAPLYTHPANPKKISSADMIARYRDAGVPAGKLVLGVPFYGKAWGDVPPEQHGLYQPASKLKQRVPASFQDVKENLENRNGYVRYWDEVSQVPMLYNAEKRIFVSYEDEQSIRAKARFVLDQGLAGMMFWQYGNDPQGRLLSAMNEALRVAR